MKHAEGMNVTLKLGKGAAFVKSRLRRLPQESEVWEADFLPKADYWMGLVIEQAHGAVFAMKMLDTTPTVNDLAHLLSDAMRRPLFEVGWHRPRSIRLRDNPEWRELVPHLEELRIDVVFSEDLLTWDDAVAEYESPVKDLWLSQRSVQMEHDHIEESFPAIAAWVQHGGWIEIGDQDGVGFVARALDCGGLVYESDDCKSLGEALCSLQDGVARWFEQRGVE